MNKEQCNSGSRTAVLALVAVLHVLCHSERVAHAGIIVSVTADVQDVGGNLFRYEYTIANDPLSTLFATDFALDVSPLADIQSITAPADWLVSYTPGDTLFYTFSLDPSTDIEPGEQATLTFFSPLAPANQAYSIFGLDPATFEFETAVGSVSSPSIAPEAEVVPEPASLVLWSLGLLTCIAIRQTRLRTSQDARNS